MDAAEQELRRLLKQHGTLIRSKGHDVYLLSNGRKAAIRRPGKQGHQDHWKSALSYLKRRLALPKRKRMKNQCDG